MIRGKTKKVSKRKSSKKITKRKTSKKKVSKRRNPYLGRKGSLPENIKDIENFLMEDMVERSDHYPPASAIRAIAKFNLDIDNDKISDNWVTDLAWQISETIMYNKERNRARKLKKGKKSGSMGIGNSPFKR